MSKNANHYLSLQRVIIFLLLEGLKYFENYRNVTQRHSEQNGWKNGADRIACHGTATNLNLSKHSTYKL